MTQPPFEPGQGGPGQPPGFGPPPAQAGSPWGGQPLAAGSRSNKRFVLVMAFFALLLVGSIAGFVLTTGPKVKDALTDTLGDGDRDGRVDTGRETVGPRVSASARPEGPVPAPVTYRGTGTKVLRIRRPEPGDALVYVKGRPVENGFFTVFGLDEEGDRTGFAVTSLGPYEGTKLLDTTGLSRTVSLEIEATGPWTVRVSSARSAPAFADATSGSGDAVVRYTGKAGIATIRGGQAMEAFIVMTRGGDGFPRVVVTSLGAFDGEKPFPRGPVLVEVQATGRWSIRVR